ncbi:MAG: pirin family protein [Bacteroidales bacterium]|nr:pirin family protein [Bacteroidales bacterium]
MSIPIATPSSGYEELFPTKQPGHCYFYTGDGEMMDHETGIIRIQALGFPWKTQDPFLFCVYHADAYPEGDGAFGPVSSMTGRNLGNDFVLKDGWRMYHGLTIPGFPVHPHRGFETVTVVRKGVVDHSDSLGGAGRYGNRDVQWMTAGKGIQHAEMFPLLNRDRTNPLELFQIWLNLPGKSKFVEPHYTMLWQEQIPLISHVDEQMRETRIELVAGSLEGLKAPDPAPDSWAASQENEVAIWYIQMDAEALWNLPPASKGTNRTLYFFEGEQLWINGTAIESGHSIELDASFSMQLNNGTEEGRFLLLQGVPIQEPVAAYGPFVMNTREEVQETYLDYQDSQFGGWPWPRPDHVHPAHKGRFALHPDGRVQTPPGKL